MKLRFLFILSVLSLSLQASGPSQAQRDRIKQIFGEDFFKNMEEFDKRYEKMMKDFFSDDFKDDFFKDQNIDNFMKSMRPHDYLSEGDFKWLETSNEHVLIVKIKQDKDSPLNIEIIDHSVKVSGTITKKVENIQGDSKSFSSYTSTFNRQFAIPKDCDPDKAKIENKDGQIYIKFPKTKANSSKPLKFKKTDKTI